MQDGAARCVGGRYDLLDPLGAGGGATVVRARDRQLPRQVAVKLLRSRDEELCRRFVQEAEVLSAIDHPSVVRVLDRGRDREDLYIVLELLAGPDLVLRPGEAPRPWREVIALGVEIAAALEAVHRTPGRHPHEAKFERVVDALDPALAVRVVFGRYVEAEAQRDLDSADRMARVLAGDRFAGTDLDEARERLLLRRLVDR
jgi:serine/threonine protein kinase